ncbi:MAG: hypothetical protein IPM84_01380 [Anaerolineae bacterium]|nr:hypothetical protein [Anaerolineae bacterium]
MSIAIQPHAEAADEAVELLRKAGLANPVRLVKLIRDTISFFELNLTDITVLTEAASGPYVVTPVIAALAGAQRVIAVTRDSPFATVNEVIAQTRAFEILCGVSNAVEIHARRTPDLFAEADIVTNLGFVRPIDAEAVAAMRQTAVVSLMCEAWEFRPGDVDLEACRARGIPIVATNEDFPGLEVFDYSGWLCLKMLFEVQIEIHKSKIIVISTDKFGRVIERQLTKAGATATMTASLKDTMDIDLAAVDALVIADYTRSDWIIGPDGDMTADMIAKINPSAVIIQFAGCIDVPGLQRNGILVYPASQLTPHRMAHTLAWLGPRPVVELHTAGLKAATSLKRMSKQEIASDSKYDDLTQLVS